jgi:hypothetical protein
MYQIWYQYRDQEPTMIDTVYTQAEAERLIDEYTFAYATHMGSISLWYEAV